MGKLWATIVNPGPLIAAEFTVTADVPVEVSVTACVVDVFTVTLPKLRLPVLTVRYGLGAGRLLPLNATAVVLPVDESLLIVNWPLALPVTVGLNCTCRVTDWFGFSVTGRLPPTNENPAPLIAAELTVTADVPVEVSVTACVVDVFTVMLPKFSCVVFSDNCADSWGVLRPRPCVES
jgi:hypothetical protein